MGWKIWNLDPLRLILTQFRVKIHNQTHVHIQYESRWLFIFITLTKGNGGREGRKVQRWDVLLKGGLGVLPQKKKIGI